MCHRAHLHTLVQATEAAMLLLLSDEQGPAPSACLKSSQACEAVLSPVEFQTLVFFPTPLFKEDEYYRHVHMLFIALFISLLICLLVFTSECQKEDILHCL